MHARGPLMAIACTCAVAPALLLSGCGRGTSDEITRIGRQNNSGTYAYFREHVLGEGREFKLGSMDQSGSKDVVGLVGRTPSAIGYSGMGYATNEVKMLKVSKEKGGEAVAPTVENAQSGTYPLARALYIYTVGEPSGAAKHFIDWCRSRKGEDIVSKVGYVPIEPVELPADQPPPEAATLKIAGSDTMVNLSWAWAEQYMKEYPNVDVQVTGGGSGTGIAKLIDGTVDLANSSRDIEPDENAKIKAAHGVEPVEATMALDALAVYVHKDNPLESISIEELAEIYGDGGTITRWTQVTGWPAQGKPLAEARSR